MKRIIIIEDDGQPGIGVSPYDGLNNNYYDPCENCSNNPKNNPNASGVCCCALPDLARSRSIPSSYQRQFDYYTTYSLNNINLN